MQALAAESFKILFSCENSAENSFASLINRARARRRARARMAWLGLLRSRGPGYCSGSKRMSSLVSRRR